MKFKQNLIILSAILVAVLILAAGCLPAPTTVPVDTDAPKLSTAVYTDVDSSGTVNLNDRVVFTFNEEMEKSTITSSNVVSRLPLSTGSYGGIGRTVSWNTAGTICTVTLGTSPTIVYGTTVNPLYLVTDVAGNTDNSTAVTISGLTAITVLSSVSISPATATTTEGGLTKTLTATALNAAAGNITSFCTFTWTISPLTGMGTISPTTGSSTVYTPPASGTGTAVITVTAVYAGVTKTATATITVGTITPPTPTVDPAKLFVSAQTGKAKYTALPAGATSVTVYSHATKDPVAAVAASAKVTIILSDWWTTMAPAIAANDHIYFMIAYSDGTTSPVTYDGQLPDAPDNAALAKIQATSKNTVTSTAAGNVAATDKITLYVGAGPTRYSDPAPVGSTMTFATNLVASDVPKYTRTNANGHESAVSGTDGQILELISAADTNVGTVNVLDAGDTLTLGFTGGLSVDVTANITVSHISWVTTGAALLGTGTLAGIGTGTTVVLTATATCADFTGAETVTFNISDTVPIVDTVGGNQVLPRATGFTFTGGASF